MEALDACARLLEKVRDVKPLVHHLTNNVTINDCANITHAIGASPIMATAIQEAAEIAGQASAVVFNIGTLEPNIIDSMIAAGKSANAKSVPVVFDPVGAGASAFRNEATARILAEVGVAVIRGNISEILAVAGLSSHTKGVEAADSDMKTDTASLVAGLSKKLGCVVAATGKKDAVSNGERTLFIDNGNSMLSRVTGTGCMCTSLIGAFLGASPGEPFEGALAAILCMGTAGEIAFDRTGEVGTGSYHMAIIDEISLMHGETLREHWRVREAVH